MMGENVISIKKVNLPQTVQLFDVHSQTNSEPWIPQNHLSSPQVIHPEKEKNVNPYAEWFYIIFPH